jgi:hypothetical protein
MLDGMRAPRAVRLEDIRNAAPEPAGINVAPSAPGITVYVSNVRRYRVEVLPATVVVDAATGRKTTTGKRITAEFDEGVYRNDHRDPATRKLIDEVLQSNKYFGQFGGGPNVHFWLASEQNAITEARRIESAMNTLKSLPPDVVARHMAQLSHGKAEDHQLDAVAPSGPTGKTSARPIIDKE